MWPSTTLNPCSFSVSRYGSGTSRVMRMKKMRMINRLLVATAMIALGATVAAAQAGSGQPAPGSETRRTSRTTTVRRIRAIITSLAPAIRSPGPNDDRPHPKHRREAPRPRPISRREARFAIARALRLAKSSWSIPTGRWSIPARRRSKSRSWHLARTIRDCSWASRPQSSTS